MRNGALSFLTKDAPQEELLLAIQAAKDKKRYITPLVASVVDTETPTPDLSNRELEVLELMARGFSNKQIAFELQVAGDTAKNHVKSILKKLNVQDRTQAATEAIQRGIIHLQW
jgi:DNA-binding NarL/FixJ family response regulator